MTAQFVDAKPFHGSFDSLPQGRRRRSQSGSTGRTVMPLYQGGRFQTTVTYEPELNIHTTDDWFTFDPARPNQTPLP